MKDLAPADEVPLEHPENERAAEASDDSDDEPWDDESDSTSSAVSGGSTGPSEEDDQSDQSEDSDGRPKSILKKRLGDFCASAGEYCEFHGRVHGKHARKASFDDHISYSDGEDDAPRNTHAAVRVAPPTHVARRPNSRYRKRGKKALEVDASILNSNDPDFLLHKLRDLQKESGELYRQRGQIIRDKQGRRQEALSALDKLLRIHQKQIGPAGQVAMSPEQLHAASVHELKEHAGVLHAALGKAHQTGEGVASKLGSVEKRIEATQGQLTDLQELVAPHVIYELVKRKVKQDGGDPLDDDAVEKAFRELVNSPGAGHVTAAEEEHQKQLLANCADSRSLKQKRAHAINPTNSQLAHGLAALGLENLSRDTVETSFGRRVMLDA